jgi:uncharacterized repeat protein (TIGR01451 family)
MRRTLALIAVAVTPALASPALAACTAQNTYSYSFNWGSNTSLNYATTYTYTASNPLGATRNFTTSFATNDLSSSLVAGVQMPAVQNLLSGAAGGRTLMIGGVFSGRTVNIAANARTIRTTFTFATPIRDLTVTVHDIDFTSNQYRDWLMVTGSNGASTYTPSMVSPLGPNNNAGPASGGGSSVAFNGYNSGGVSVTSRDRVVGIGSSPNTNSNVGDVVISFAEPVTSVTLRYGNYPFTAGEGTTGQQAYGISTITFCPMPNVTVAKTSAPLATTGPDRFNTPGSEVVYTLTVTNSGGSPVDLNGLVLTDALPTTVSFYNGDFDTGAPGTDPFSLTAGSSGVTLTAANVSYSNNGGSTYTYVPAAGYDPAVNGVRFAPGGSLAANSSFTIRFRALVE